MHFSHEDRPIRGFHFVKKSTHQDFPFDSLFEGLNYTYHTDKPVVEPGDQRLKSNAFLFWFGHPYKRNEKSQLHRNLGNI